MRVDGASDCELVGIAKTCPGHHDEVDARAKAHVSERLAHDPLHAVAIYGPG